MTISVGKRSGNAIVPYSQTTRRTKVVDNSILDIQLSSSTPATTIAGIAYVEAYAYSDSIGNWRLSGNFRVTTNVVTTSSVFTMTGVSSFSTAATPLTCYYEDSNAYMSATSFNIINGTGRTAQIVSFDIPLDSEPTWAAANMEASTNASIYIEPASASQAGLVDTAAQSFAGVKTFADGIKPSSDSTALTSYKEGTFTAALGGATNMTDLSGGALTDDDIAWGTCRYTRIGNLVTCTIFTMTGMKIGTAGSRTYFSVSFAGLPAMNSETVSVYADCRINTGLYEPLILTGHGAGTSAITIYLNTATALGATNGDPLIIAALRITYEVAT